eukprot:TRINITY_DN1113_c0_g2_i2.p1 TRINITY_DN1113_c0_g2~~TRINITY_DN1113_c0_g2_i2.p1  ORF type:complete len:277 (-),score=47.39 TRINITY_DN1113_c0_g2_i2:62-892(-)
MDALSDVWRVLGVKDLLPLKSNKTLSKYFNDFDDFIFSTIENRKKNRSQDDQKVLLDILIDASDETSGLKLTNNEVKNNINAFFLAGHETTSSALTMIAYELSRNLHVQEKARQLVLEKFGRDSELSHDKVNQVPYINAIINEALRLHPPVPMLARFTATDVELSGYPVPKNTNIIVPTYSLHRFEESWGQDANQFRPERWIKEGFKPPSGRYLPFGKGTRICLGNMFTMLEMRIALVLFLQNFEILPSPLHPQFKLGDSLTVRPQEGFTLLFKPL